MSILIWHAFFRLVLLAPLVQHRPRHERRRDEMIARRESRR